MRTAPWISTFALIAAVSFAYASDEARALKLAKIDKAPAIDGKLDEDCWRSATAVTNFSADTGKPAQWQTTAYVCRDDANLYIAFKCLMQPGTKPVGKPGPHDSNVFNDDVVEIMIDPGRTESTCYQLAMNAAGATFDCSRSQGGAGENDAWNGTWEGKTTIADDSWSAEFKIPYFTLGVTSSTPTRWGINLARETINPREISSIGQGGSFTNIPAFADLEDAVLEAANHGVRIGQPVTILSRPGDASACRLVASVTNDSDHERKLNIRITSAAAEGKTTEKTEQRTLGVKESAQLDLEPLTAKPIVDGSSVYAITQKATVQRIQVDDAESKATLAQHSVTLRPYCEALTLKVSDALLDASDAKARNLRVAIRANIDFGQLEGGKIGLKLISSSGDTVATQDAPSKGNEIEVAIPAASVPWGAYKLVATFHDKGGKAICSADAAALVLPGGKQQIKPLNNLVSELMDAKDRGLLGQKQIDFMNPRDGWCLFELSGAGQVAVDDPKQPLAALSGDRPEQVMRFLPAGKHTVRLAEGEKSAISSLVIRAIPEMQYADFGESPKLKEFGAYDWEYLERIGLTRCLNVMTTRFLDPEKDRASAEKWTAQGKRFMHHHWPPLGPARSSPSKFPNAEQSYDEWVTQPGLNEPNLAGLILDEFFPYDGVEAYFPFYTSAVRKLMSEKPGRSFYLYLAAGGSAEDYARLIRPLLGEKGFHIASERYFAEGATEAQAKRIIDSMLVRQFKSFTEVFPGLGQKLVFVPSLLCAPPEFVNVNPSVSYKVFMEMQYHTMATHPDMKGLYGLQLHHSGYADEEYLRWGAKLFQHYGIEGRTDRLTQDPYVLDHIQNPDFVNGVDGWTVAAAEPGSVSTKEIAGFGPVQGRYLQDSRRGDAFLVTRRSSSKPNTVSQQIRNLKPGRTYSVKMLASAHPDLSAEPELLGASISIAGGEMVEGKKIQGTYFTQMHPKFTGKYRYLNYFRIVFKAQSDSATLTISDWKSNAQPGGPAGQELAINFIEVEPYLMEEP